MSIVFQKLSSTSTNLLIECLYENSTVSFSLPIERVLRELGHEFVESEKCIMCEESRLERLKKQIQNGPLCNNCGPTDWKPEPKPE